ncbi:hypothetical protein STCU_00370 [Strigomonas culicis]|uniref:Bromo domain-containing protein n=1 Tax=Strigomonas culicis TaxID=28005 RepID=S9U4M1_9TRYP|nr:hypothetical protein STCU_06521 [Strigomonas culicis]EPY36861.1 hypothetical protein STCU_00370 [Strigomonas culicis]|eukprot:EPY25722.1 hypothetical protein STCU_06521 [Strigomonas culicis]
MSTTAADPAADIKYWLQYIDCALHHPHLPSGRHSYNASLSTVPEVRDLYHSLYKLYSEHSCSVNFREPVNALQLGALHYYDVITEPMSLRTVLDRIAAGGHYTTTAQVLRDVDLIWSNCAKFNGGDSVITAEARSCAKTLQSLRQAFEDEQLASTEDIDSINHAVESCNNYALMQELIDYFKANDPSMLDAESSLDLASLKVRHVKVMRAIIDRYVVPA